MTVRERVLTLRLLERSGKYPAYTRALGIVISDGRERILDAK